MLELDEKQTNQLLGVLPREAPNPVGRRPGIKNFDMATRVLMGVSGTVQGVEKTRREVETEAETLDGDIVPVVPSRPTIANARDGKIGKRVDSELSNQVALGLTVIEEIGVDRLQRCLEAVSEEEILDLEVRDRVGMGVHLATILEKIAKRTGGNERAPKTTINFYTPKGQKSVRDYGDVIEVEREEGE